MAKIFKRNENTNEISIPTAESNVIKLKIIQERNEQLKIIRVSDSLDEVMKSQYGNINVATGDAGMAVLNEEFAGTDTPNQNQDMSQYPQAKNTDEMDKSSLVKLADSMPPVLVYILFGFVAIAIFRFLFGKRG